jgi:hypothetical protein
VRVGIVTAEYPPDVGGVGDHSARLARELAALGHQVDVVTSARPAPPDAGTAVRVRPVVRRWDWRIWWLVPRLARRAGWVRSRSALVRLIRRPSAWR